MCIPTWRTKTGKIFNVSEMETCHIQNALAMLKSKGYIGPSTLRFYATCEPPIADMALMAFENEYIEVMKRPVHQMIDCFECELSRRGEGVEGGNMWIG